MVYKSYIFITPIPESHIYIHLNRSGRNAYKDDENRILVALKKICGVLKEPYAEFIHICQNSLPSLYYGNHISLKFKLFSVIQFKNFKKFAFIVVMF